MLSVDFRGWENPSVQTTSGISQSASTPVVCVVSRLQASFILVERETEKKLSEGASCSSPVTRTEAGFSLMCVLGHCFWKKNILLVDFSPCVLCVFMIEEKENRLYLISRSLRESKAMCLVL